MGLSSLYFLLDWSVKGVVVYLVLGRKGCWESREGSLKERRWVE
jgi:hypothetical protein